MAPYDDQGPRRTSRTTLFAWAAVVFVLAVGVALAGSQIFLTGFGGSDSAKGGTGQDTSAPTDSNAPPTGQKIKVKHVASFDPEGDGEENDADAPLVADGKRSTVWITNFYNDPFGPTGLKDGVGLVLDLGSKQDVSAVRIVTVGGGTDLQVGFADRFDAQSTPAGGLHHDQAHRPRRGRTGHRRTADRRPAERPVRPRSGSPSCPWTAPSTAAGSPRSPSTADPARLSRAGSVPTYPGRALLGASGTRGG